MRQYHQLLKEVLGRGDVQFEPRTQEYILGISAWQSIYDLREGFPLVTTKSVPPRLPFEELFWKLRGERNVLSLINQNIDIWTANAFDRYLKQSGQAKDFPKHSAVWNKRYEQYRLELSDSPQTVGNGDLGPVYGYQWRHWLDSKGKEVDQLEKLLRGLKEKPGSRYHILSSWNVGDLPEMALGPCPFWHQFSVWANGKIDLTMVQRSCDVFLGVPFNIAQDSLLAHLIAKETGFIPRLFNHSYINVHAYLGVPPRANFWLEENHVRDFQGRFNEIKNKSEYLDLKAWYLKNVPAESSGNERKDHIPFILEQLSREPRELPALSIKKDLPLLEAITRPPLDTVGIENYNPHKWDSKAIMAA
ncbi:MAG: thymidylate synthase [Candidatus Nanoarchaeia archaeon]|nr:thymidylate synthase [Candidatus Nanoarchaeia archaeon]